MEPEQPLNALLELVDIINTLADYLIPALVALLVARILFDFAKAGIETEEEKAQTRETVSNWRHDRTKEYRDNEAWGDHWADRDRYSNLK